MHVLALQGSPRHSGHTDTLLQAVLAPLSEGFAVKKYSVTELKMGPCASCYACAKLGHCPIPDDMQELYPGLATASVVILASPIYFYGLTAQLKTVIDRCQTFWTNPNSTQKGRTGVLLLTAGARDKSEVGRLTATATAKIFLECIGAPLTHVIAAVNTDSQPVSEQVAALAEAQKLGQSLRQAIYPCV